MLRGFCVFCRDFVDSAEFTKKINKPFRRVSYRVLLGTRPLRIHSRFAGQTLTCAEVCQTPSASARARAPAQRHTDGGGMRNGTSSFANVCAIFAKCSQVFVLISQVFEQICTNAKFAQQLMKMARQLQTVRNILGCSRKSSAKIR